MSAATRLPGGGTLEVFFEEEELLISAYLEEHADVFSSLIKVLEITELKSTLNAYGHYTFFAPDDDAFNKFRRTKGKVQLKNLIRIIWYTLVRIT